MQNIFKKTKIIATLGPASNTEEKIKDLILAGVNIFRLNFSHGLPTEKQEIVKIIRKVSEKLNIPVAILADLQGPKIRTTKTKNDQKIILEKGKIIKIGSKNLESNQNYIDISYPNLIDEIKENQFILINDGYLKIQVKKINVKEKTADCVVCNTGEYSSFKGVNFPNIDLKVPSLTEKDLKDLDFILNNLKEEINFIALSFVRKSEDLDYLKASIKQHKAKIKVISKIEKPEAISNFCEILDNSDGIMVARGDLGIETSPELVPMLQKDFINKSNKKGKMVIVATQMLESMIKNPLPTRAEVSDVSNAILDGADAVMLSAESAAGDYPVESVLMMKKIAQITESSPVYEKSLDKSKIITTEKKFAHVLCESAVKMNNSIGNSPIIVFSGTGYTAAYMSKLRNSSPIYAFVPNKKICEELSAYWNVVPFYLEFDKKMSELKKEAEDILKNNSLIKDEDVVIVLSATDLLKEKTDFLRVKKVGSL
jgi:pyruvate kinase